MSLRASSPFGGARSQEHLEVVAGPPGTYSPGTVLEVNHTQVIVERFLAEGGFAHVYVVRTESYEELVLKRTACPDEDSLEDLKNEIDVMRTVSGHKNIVQYYDSSIAPMRHGGYEIFILMENCSGGHLVDLLNSRLHTRLTEAEILSIFSDVCEAVAHLHYHPRGPILHRDIKVENVLIASDGTYKLCDFGSSTRKIIPAGSSLSMPEIRKLEADIDRFTTLQYRAPELCDLYQRKGISEKVDIWALGILLFKLCYLTTPFEDNGKMAILNVRYTVPPFPIYSHAFTYLIQSMLKSEVGERASIHQVFSMVCSLRGVPCHLQEVSGTNREKLAIRLTACRCRRENVRLTSQHPSCRTLLQ
ncbi:kinase-like domain-containing protein [Zopfochytrium polystomum]|nr:kinase-like domain-containing protein [Zopfochytrium polystomum]